jgi:hypothetical protein
MAITNASSSCSACCQQRAPRAIQPRSFWSYVGSMSLTKLVFIIREQNDQWSTVRCCGAAAPHALIGRTSRAVHCKTVANITMCGAGWLLINGVTMNPSTHHTSTRLASSKHQIKRHDDDQYGKKGTHGWGKGGTREWLVVEINGRDRHVSWWQDMKGSRFAE